MMFRNFNKLIFESLIDSSEYHFSNDQNGNIFCTFTIKNNLVVTAKQFNDILTFDITDKNGDSKNLSQKQFSVEYADQYNQFKKKLNSYLANDYEKEETETMQGDSKIKNFDDQVEDQKNHDQNSSNNHDIKIGDTLFNFKTLKDLMVSNYCQCIFQFFDQKQNQTRGVKSLLVVKPKNSIIIKSILQNYRGETLLIMTEKDFEQQYPEVYLKFKQAIKKYEDYYQNNVLR